MKCNIIAPKFSLDPNSTIKAKLITGHQPPLPIDYQYVLEMGAISSLWGSGLLSYELLPSCKVY